MTSLPKLDGCPYIALSSYSWNSSTSNHSGCNRSLPLNITVYCIFAAMHAVAIWVALGLIIGVVWTFKRRNTLCFWSLITTCVGIIVITIGLDIPMFANTEGPVNRVFLTIMNIGWILMMTGFALTLYSRLHLILCNQKVLRLLLIMIIANGIIGHVPAIVVGYLSWNANTLRAEAITSKFKVVFYAQEILLSSLYSVLFFKFASSENAQNEHWNIDAEARSTFFGLITGQIVVLLCDVTSIVLLFLDLYLARKLVLPFNYALKALIEFFVLNQLVRFSCKRAGRLEVCDIEADVKDGSIQASGAPTESCRESYQREGAKWMLD